MRDGQGLEGPRGVARALARANYSGEGALAVGEEGQWEEGMLGSGYTIASGQANQLQVRQGFKSVWPGASPLLIWGLSLPFCNTGLQ